MAFVVDPFPASGNVADPSRNHMRPLTADITVSILAAAIAAATRLGLEQLVVGIAPFILTFPIVMAVTLLRGGRAGAITTLLCQMLTIRFVFPNWVSIHGNLYTDLANVILSTIALAGTVWATASYRSAAALLRSRCQHRVDTLSLLMDEMDHRTKNNYQVAAGLLARQSVAVGSAVLARELDKASSRLSIMASAFQSLPTDADRRHTVELGSYIERVVTALRGSLTPEHVTLRYRGDATVVPFETAIIIGLIVNEWVTNALKYAFDDGPGGIFVDVAASENGTEVVVDDDGELSIPLNDEGQGTELVKSFAEIIGGSISITRDNGTRCVLTLPADGGSPT